jgi:glycosyltransferase involved in cell wall biosynthesis
MTSRPPTHDVAIYSPAASALYEQRDVTDLSRWGGAEFQATLLAASLASQGFRVAHVVYPVHELRAVPEPSLSIVERQAFSGERGLGGFQREVRAVWQALADADADAYIVRKGGGYLAPAAAFCRRRRRKLILSASNDLDFVFDRADRSRVVLRMYRWGLRRTDAVVVQNPDQVRLARDHVGPRTQVELIPSFTEPAERQRASGEAFLWVNRLAAYKQPMRYIELARALPDARFRMVGIVNNETRPELVAEVNEAARAVPNLELLEPRPRPELLQILEQSIAVVSTSRFEGMPNVFLESWARGIPVLTLDFDPDRLVASEGLGIAAAGDFDRFVDAAGSLWSDPELRADLGENARAYVRRVHEPEAVAGRWADLLRRLLGRAG